MVTVNTCKTQDFEMDYIKFGTGDKTFVIIPGLSVQIYIAQNDKYKI